MRYLILLLFTPLFNFSQNTYVPDDNFEQALIDLGFDSGVLNDSVPTASIDTITTLDINSKSISDITGIENFTALTNFFCYYNQLTNLPIANNSNLSVLICSQNPLQSIDISQNTNLTSLSCSFNQLDSLDVTNNTLLTTLRCEYNFIAKLDLSNNLDLETITCSYNQLTSLNLNNNTQIIRVGATNNSLVEVYFRNGNNLNILYSPHWFDLRDNWSLECIEVDDPVYSTTNWTYVTPNASYSSQCNYGLTETPDPAFETALINLGLDTLPIDGFVPTQNIDTVTELYISFNGINDITGIEDFEALEIFECQLNNINSIDVSSLLNLVSLNCSFNDLTYLNVKNGLNTNFTYFNAFTNPNLSCIQVDDQTYSNINWTFKDNTSTYNGNCSTFGFTTYVPDNHFETKLINLGLDTLPLDNYVFTANVSGVTNLNIPRFGNPHIRDLTGIEAFANLQYLNIDNHIIDTLDLSANTSLITLEARGTGIRSIALPASSNLTTVWLHYNYLTNIDITQSPNLDYLAIGYNSLIDLDLSQNTVLTKLYIEGNNFIGIDLSNNTSLAELHAYDNNLFELDLSNNLNLLKLFVYNNNLHTLNLKSGGNTSVTHIEIHSNPNLECVSVDIPSYSTTNWTIRDATTSYYNVCETYVPDDAFEDYLETHNAQGIAVPFGNVTSMGNQIANDNYVTTSSINSVISLDINNQYIVDLTGIEDFVLLKELIAYENNIITADFSNNVNLVILNCSRNNLTYLNITNNILLEELYCSDHQMVNIDLTQNTVLNYLNCTSGQLVSLNVINNDSLETLYCGNNFITQLDLFNNLLLKRINCQDNRLTKLNLRNGTNTIILEYNSLGNVDLLCIEVDESSYSRVFWTQVDSWSRFMTSCQTTDISNDEESIIFNYILYPNPGSDYFYIKGYEKDIRYVIYNAFGKICGQGFTSKNKKVNIENLRKGIYFVKINNENLIKFVNL